MRNVKVVINRWMRSECTLGRDAPNQFSSKTQFMGRHKIKNDQRFRYISNAFYVKINFSHNPPPLCVCIDESSATNSNFIANARTTESPPRDVFTLNNHVLFIVNNTTFSVIQSE